MRASRGSASFDRLKNIRGISMFRKFACVAALIVAGALHSAAAQTTAAPATSAPAATEAKPGKLKLTAQKLKDMKDKWSANKGKLRECRKEVKAKGLAGDDRWFYISDCMDKT
jgi:hypothetical protein